MYIYNKYLYSKYEIYRKFRTFYFYRFLCEIIISKEMTGNANMRFVSLCASQSIITVRPGATSGLFAV